MLDMVDRVLSERIHYIQTIHVYYTFSVVS